MFEATRALEPPARRPEAAVCARRAPCLAAGRAPWSRRARATSTKAKTPASAPGCCTASGSGRSGSWWWRSSWAAAFWAALTWQTWFPKAGELGEQALTAIDRQVRSKEIESARQQVLEEASEQLPQLAPETIALVLSRQPGRRARPARALPGRDRRGGPWPGFADSTRRRWSWTRSRTSCSADSIRTERQHVRDYERAREARTAFALRGARSARPARAVALARCRPSGSSGSRDCLGRRSPPGSAAPRRPRLASDVAAAPSSELWAWKDSNLRLAGYEPAVLTI